MKRKNMLILLLIVVVATVSACSNSKDSKKKNLTFTTGTTTVVFYPLGAVVSVIWDKNMDEKITSQASNGSVENLTLMQKGEADLGFTTVNIIWEAYNGKGSFEGNAYKDIRVLANLYPNANHIIVQDNKGMNDIKDLKGKSFVFGAPGSATELESKLVLEANGLSEKDVKSSYVGFTEAVDLFRNNQVDAINVYTGVPAAAATELITTSKSKVINLTEDAIQFLTSDKYPWNFKYVIEANTYEKQTSAINTVAQYSSIVIDAGIPDETVYKLTKIFWENLDEIEQGHAIAKQFDSKVAAKNTADVPIHPGAEKYYKEIGVMN